MWLHVNSLCLRKQLTETELWRGTGKRKQALEKYKKLVSNALLSNKHEEQKMCLIKVNQENRQIVLFKYLKIKTTITCIFKSLNSLHIFFDGR